MSEGRGLTLRKKRKDRPQISGPTSLPSKPRPDGPTLQPSQGSSNLSIPQERNAPSETTDMVKRRYSTRYNQLPDFSNIDTPAVPALPGAFKRQSRGGSPKRYTRDTAPSPLKVDQTALSDPNLQHDRYVANLLSNASEEDIQEYQNGLQRVRKRTSADLQQSVYQNRTQFIKISKEAERLKSEMQVLRGLMSDLTGALAQTNSSATTNGITSPELNGSSPGLSRRNTNRSSVANLESMWNIQLQTLWKNVEKSQKSLPAIPGRHILMENGSWVQLDSATWKPQRPVHMVLLNDHLLIASKKRKRMDPNVPNQGPAPTKLVAEECFPLQDIDLVDMATQSSALPAEERAIATAVTLRTAGRSLTYRSEKRDAKAKQELLQTFRKAVEDLRKANKIETSTSSSQKDSLNYFASRDPASARNADILESLNSSTRSSSKPDILIEVEGRQQNFRWVESQIDELDIDVALQRFEEAVEKVEKLRSILRSFKSNSIAQELIQLKLDERVAKLSALLCRDLTENPASASATQRTVSFLARLGAEDKARESYLSSRTASLTQRARQCVFEGDLHRYVFSLSYVYFTMIKNTVLTYQSSFAPAMMSSVVAWADTQLKSFNQVLVRHLSSIDRRGPVWRECMDVVWEFERALLGENGLDFREVIGRNLEVRDIPVERSASAMGGAGGAGSPAAAGGGRRPSSGRRDSERSQEARGNEQSRSKSRPRGGVGVGVGVAQ